MNQIIVSVEIKAPELAEAIVLLASALAIGKNSQNPVFAEKAQELQQAATPVAPVTPEVPQPAPVAAPQSTPAAVPVGAPVTPEALPPNPLVEKAPEAPPAAPVMGAVPTTAPTYTMDQLAVAATSLMDAGRRAELVNLLAAFGVQALTALPKEQYGNFATKLRELGAKI